MGSEDSRVLNLLTWCQCIVKLRTCGIECRKIRENEPWYLSEWPWIFVSLKKFGLDLFSSGEIMQVPGSYVSRACFKQVKVIKFWAASYFVESYVESWCSFWLWLHLWSCWEGAPQRGKVCIKKGYLDIGQGNNVLETLDPKGRGSWARRVF